MPCRGSNLISVGFIALLVSASPSFATAEKPANHSRAPAQKISFQKDVQPLLERYCYGCHGEKKKGDLDLRIYRNETLAGKDRRIFEKVLKNLRAHEMPPENKPQPSPAERDLIAGWAQEFFFPCDCKHPDPGRVTIRRLNRVEYNNTVRDLVGLTFNPADDFPADDSGYGFDNIGDVLSLSPVLLEKYLAAAEKVLADADPVWERDEFKTGKSDKPSVFSPLPHERAEVIIENFGRRAFRHPMKQDQLDRYLALFQHCVADGDTFEKSIQLTLEAMLVSPNFLFHGEIQPEPGNPSRIVPLDDYSLASRLSYFLWSSMPDEELFALAERGKLRANLEKQVQRMLKDPKSSAFVENFTGQWLQLRNLDLVAPDHEEFPEFKKSLRVAMRRETELFFESILREDRSVLDLIGANYTFLNEKLAHLYNLDGVAGEEFRRVSLETPPKGTASPAAAQRGGLLTQASILTLTSNPTRTSPVKRGKWVLENILGAPPPPPPPDVPKLDEEKSATTGTLRHRMEEHRNNPACASCHARMDPIGFGFENYNGIGAWRDIEGGAVIDPSGELVSGESFKGPAELKAILLNQKRNDFIRCLTEKMLTYALGRGLEYYDKCAVDKICEQMAKGNYKFSTLITGIVNSAPFQMRRGEQAPVTAQSASTR